jgi:hypothetical protein
MVIPRTRATGNDHDMGSSKLGREPRQSPPYPAGRLRSSASSSSTYRALLAVQAGHAPGPARFIDHRRYAPRSFRRDAPEAISARSSASERVTTSSSSPGSSRWGPGGARSPGRHA